MSGRLKEKKVMSCCVCENSRKTMIGCYNRHTICIPCFDIQLSKSSDPQEAVCFLCQTVYPEYMTEKWEEYNKQRYLLKSTFGMFLDQEKEKTKRLSLKRKQSKKTKKKEQRFLLNKRRKEIK
jgi:hypothetical protein